MNVGGRSRIFRFSTATAYIALPWSAFRICCDRQCFVSMLCRPTLDMWDMLLLLLLLYVPIAYTKLIDIWFDRQIPPNTNVRVLIAHSTDANRMGKAMLLCIHNTWVADMCWIYECIDIDAEKRDWRTDWPFWCMPALCVRAKVSYVLWFSNRDLTYWNVILLRYYDDFGVYILCAQCEDSNLALG